MNLVDYSQFVELHLNLDRVRARKQLDQIDVLDIASGKRTVPAEWFNLICDSPNEAARMLADQGVELLKRHD